jgi:hypothetical protein
MAANGPNSAPLGVNLPTMLSGLDTQYSAENFIASDAIAQGIGLHKPDVDPELVRRYGRDDLSGLLSMVPGYTKGIKNRIEYYHGEKDFIHGLVQVEEYVAAAAFTTTLTFNTNSVGSVPYANPPYLEGAPPQSIPTAVPQKYDVLQLPGRFELVVISVDKTLGTMEVGAVTDETIPAIAATDQIIIKGSTQPEASRAGESRNSRLLSYKNNMFIHRRDHKVTGTEMGEQTWMTFRGKGGKKGNVWYLEALYDEYQRFKNEVEMMLFDGKQIGNATLTGIPGFETITKTEGLITTIETAGNNVIYIAGGLLLSDVGDMNRSLNKFKGDKKNLLMSGYDFRDDLNKLWREGDGLGDAATDPGRITFANSQGIEDMAVNLDFHQMKLNGFRYFIKQTNAFSDPTTLGAVDQGYEAFGIVIPMGNTVTYNDLSDQSSSEQVKSIRMNYKIEKAGISRAYKEWVTGGAGGFKTSDEDAMQCHQLAQVGLEVFAANRYGLFKTAA